MLEAISLTKKYGSFTALDKLSFTVKKGEILGLIGENGAGKSTTLRILAGLIKPTYGEVRYFGRKFDNSIKQKLGYLPEADALYDSMMPTEYLSFFAEIYNQKNVDRKIDNLLKMLDIPEKPISELSKGNKRKLSIARTLIHDPEILIYDEPTGGLDPGTSLFIADLMRKMAEMGKITVFSAHNMYYVERIADTVIVLKEGRSLYYGRLKDLLSENIVYRVSFVLNDRRELVEVESSSELSEIVEEIYKCGGKVLEIEKEVPRLENIYFSLMKSSDA